MHLSEYQEISRRTVPVHDTWEERKDAISNYSMGLFGEGGELVDALKKFVHHGHTFDIFAAEEEIGDILHYVSGLATLLGLNLDTIAKNNIKKLEKRYPTGFTSEDSIKRVDRKKG